MNLSEYSNIIPLGCSSICTSVVNEINKLSLLNVQTLFSNCNFDIQSIYETTLQIKEDSLDIERFLIRCKQFPFNPNYKEKLEEKKQEIINFKNNFFTQRNLLLYTDLKNPDYNVYKPKRYYMDNFDYNFNLFQSKITFLQELFKLNTKNEIIYFSDTIGHFKNNIPPIDGSINLIDLPMDGIISQLNMAYSHIKNYNPVYNMGLPPNKNYCEQDFLHKITLYCIKSINSFLNFNYR